MDWKASDGSPDYKALINHIAECANKENGKVVQLLDKLSEMLKELLTKPEAAIPLVEFSPHTVETDRKENCLAWSIGTIF